VTPPAPAQAIATVLYRIYSLDSLAPKILVYLAGSAHWSGQENSVKSLVRIPEYFAVAPRRVFTA